MIRSSDPDALATASDAAYYREQRLDRDASREPRKPAPPLTADDYAERTALAVPLMDDEDPRRALREGRGDWQRDERKDGGL